MKKTRLSDIFNTDSIRNRKRILDRFEINKKEKRLFLDAVEEIEDNGDGSNIGNILEEKDCNFYDCDGTLLYTYSKEEALALTELPPFPVHLDKEIECIGYTHSLEEIINAGGILDIGCMYATIDDSLRFLIEIQSDYYKEIHIPIDSELYIVDWGDGIVNNSNSHIYDNYGSFIIKIKLLKSTNYIILYKSYSDSIQYVVKEIFLPKTYYVLLQKTCFRDTHILEIIWYNYNLGFNGTNTDIYEQFRYTYNLKYVFLNESSNLKFSYCYNSCVNCKVLIIKNYNREPGYHINISLFKIKSLCLNNIAKYSYNNNNYRLPYLEKLNCSKTFNTTNQIRGLITSCNINKCYLNNVAAKDSTTQGILSITYLKYYKDVESIANNINYVCEIDLTEFNKVIPLSGKINIVSIIKVKKELIEEYKVATNWSNHSTKFVGV